MYQEIITSQMISIRILSCSPYQLKVRPRVEPDQVKVEGPGVSGKGIPASLPAEFTIDTSQAGYGDLEVQVKVSYS
jgi:filamin